MCVCDSLIGQRAMRARSVVHGLDTCIKSRRRFYLKVISLPTVTSVPLPNSNVQNNRQLAPASGAAAGPGTHTHALSRVCDVTGAARTLVHLDELHGLTGYSSPRRYVSSYSLLSRNTHRHLSANMFTCNWIVSENTRHTWTARL